MVGNCIDCGRIYDMGVEVSTRCPSCLNNLAPDVQEPTPLHRGRGRPLEILRRPRVDEGDVLEVDGETLDRIFADLGSDELEECTVCGKRFDPTDPLAWVDVENLHPHKLDHLPVALQHLVDTVEVVLTREQVRSLFVVADLWAGREPGEAKAALEAIAALRREVGPWAEAGDKVRGVAVYVDPLRRCGSVEKCHMAVGSNAAVSRLHDFARSIGVSGWSWHKSKRFPHYDLTAQQRAAAVEAGAVEVDSRTLVRLSRRARISTSS